MWLSLHFSAFTIALSCLKTTSTLLRRHCISFLEQDLVFGRLPLASLWIPHTFSSPLVPLSKSWASPKAILIVHPQQLSFLIFALVSAVVNFPEASQLVSYGSVPPLLNLLESPAVRKLIDCRILLYFTNSWNWVLYHTTIS